MAKRKSNRAARHILAQGKDAQIYRVSNRRQMHQMFADYPGIVCETKPSRQQRRGRMQAYDLSGIVYCDCRNYI